MSERDEWVLVKSFDELFVGCAVKVPLCKRCGKRHVTVLTGGPKELFCDTPTKGVQRILAFDTADVCRGIPLGVGVSSVIAQNVYRLRPDEPAASDETAAPAKVRKPVAVRP